LFLAVDIGNTQTSFGFIQDEKITHHFRLQTKAFRTPDEYASFLFPLLQLHKIAVADIERILLCSVVPPADPFFEDFCQHYFKQRPFKVTPQSRLMFRMNLKTPEEVGADRIANVAYAVESFKLPCMVIDIGTATTFDVISKEKSYEGGIIFPGVEQMSIGFVKYTLQRHLVKFEQEINRKVFRYAGRFCEFATAGLERGDTKTRNEAYRIALGRAGEPAWMTVNEVRRRENLPPVDGGDELATNAAVQPPGTQQ
jgi:pantothenate kinase type III